MPLTLILTRHAKSGWDDPTLDDFDRPLNARGRKSADAIGKWLSDRGHLPDLVLVSGAKRTVDTWGRMAGHFPDTATMESNPALYMASADTILNLLRNQSAQRLMVICHNPGIAAFADQIATTPPDHPRFPIYPTCATTVLTFDADAWRDVGWSSGNVVDFTVPRDLTD